jgi:hypothetical protein
MALGTYHHNQNIGHLALLTSQTVVWGSEVIHMGVDGLRALRAFDMPHRWIFRFPVNFELLCIINLCYIPCDCD